MTDRSSRRRFLYTIGASSSAVATGCLDSWPGLGDGDGDDGGDADHPEETTRFEDVPNPRLDGD